MSHTWMSHVAHTRCRVRAHRDRGRERADADIWMRHGSEWESWLSSYKDSHFHLWVCCGVRCFLLSSKCRCCKGCCSVCCRVRCSVFQCALVTLCDWGRETADRDIWMSHGSHHMYSFLFCDRGREMADTDIWMRHDSEWEPCFNICHVMTSRHVALIM